MCQPLECYYSGCRHFESYGTARCPPIRYSNGQCEGLEETKYTRDRGDCGACRAAELDARDARIRASANNLVAWGYWRTSKGDWVNEDGKVLVV